LSKTKTRLSSAGRPLHVAVGPSASLLASFSSLRWAGTLDLAELENLPGAVRGITRDAAAKAAKSLLNPAMILPKWQDMRQVCHYIAINGRIGYNVSR